jgi:hypothetical protein
MAKKKINRLHFNPKDPVVVDEGYQHIGYKYDFDAKSMVALLLPTNLLEFTMRRELSEADQAREKKKPFAPTGNQYVEDGKTLVSRITLTPEALACIAHFTQVLRYEKPVDPNSPNYYLTPLQGPLPKPRKPRQPRTPKV